LNDPYFTNANKRQSIIETDFHAFNLPFTVNFNYGHSLAFNFKY